MNRPTNAKGFPAARRDLIAIGAISAFAYCILFLDLATGVVHPVAHLANGTVVGAVALVYVLRAPALADELDGKVLGGFLLFVVACVFSQFPRQSLDAALGGLLSLAALFVAR